MIMDIRIPDNCPLIVVKNTALRDEKVSLEARGLYATLQSLPPENRDLESMALICPDDIKVLREAFKELMEAGYIKGREVV